MNDFLIGLCSGLILLIILGLIANKDKPITQCQPHSKEYVGIVYHDGECAEWPKSMVKLGKE